jgi:hypothetical protein
METCRFEPEKGKADEKIEIKKMEIRKQEVEIAREKRKITKDLMTASEQSSSKTTCHLPARGEPGRAVTPSSRA